ncbi:MAG: ABC transporter permease/substrate-binding protein [Acidobacteriota bacterium]
MTGELLRGLPPLLASHLELALVALVAGIAIGLPVAIAIAPRPRLALPVITAAGVVQTVPGLALLALMVPVLARTHGLAVGLSSFGFAPAAIALTLYALLPILRNAITGLRGVDASAVEAATGMGMTRGQILRQVELPLAAPVIAAGIRTASVWTVGAATLATPVGQPCLGNYIFAGLQTRNWAMLLVGVAASAALAIALDLLLGAAEHALAGRKRKRVAWPIAGFAALCVVVIAVLPAIGARASDVRRPTAESSGGRRTPDAGRRLRIGAKTYTEQYILAELLRARLHDAGLEAEVSGSLGSTVIFDALVHGDLDAYVDYSGTIWTNLMHRAPGAPRWQVLVEVEAWLAREHHVRALGSLGFENAYALAVRRDTADKLGLHSLRDLAAHAHDLRLGADYEFFSRAEWASVRDTYGLSFARQASFDPTLLYDAVSRGEVDVIAAFSSDGRIAAHDLVVLDDPAGALPPYDAMILLGPSVADDPRVACALAPLAGALPVELVRQANLMVDRDSDKATPAAAAAWLLQRSHLANIPHCATTSL